MESYRTNTDPKAIENNYSRKLSIFANKLHQHTNVFKQQLSELKRINTSLLAKRQQILQLKKPMTTQRYPAYFSGSERTDVLTMVESEAYTELRRIVEIFKEQKESIKALKLEHATLAAAGIALEMVNIPFEIVLNHGSMPAGVSPLYSGNSRQKSMNFYVSESNKILDEWGIRHTLCTAAAGTYFVRFPNDFETFQKTLDRLDSSSQSLDDYLMFCSFLINQK